MMSLIEIEYLDICQVVCYQVLWDPGRRHRPNLSCHVSDSVVGKSRIGFALLLIA